MAALNIQIEVPEMRGYEVEELKRKLIAYAGKLVSSFARVSEVERAKKYKHESLAGIFAEQEEGDDLRDLYIKEKYGI